MRCPFLKYFTNIHCKSVHLHGCYNHINVGIENRHRSEKAALTKSLAFTQSFAVGLHLLF